jgi:hypothetical protein
MTLITDNKTELKLYLLFIPVAYISYIFHEFGHWSIGELLGNDMVYSLNYVWPRSGKYIDPVHGLYVSLGGPAFTVLLALGFLLIIEKFKTIYAFPVVFFQMFLRFFSLVFGVFSEQDEARISVILDLGKYTIAIVVVLILLSMVWRASYILNINLKKNAYFFTMSTFCILLVIGTYKFIF